MEVLNKIKQGLNFERETNLQRKQEVRNISLPSSGNEEVSKAFQDESLEIP